MANGSVKLSFKQTKAEFMVRVASTLLFNKLVKANSRIMSVREITENIQYGYTEKASESEIGPKYVRITDLKDGQVNWKTVPYCKCDNPEQYLLKQGDLIFARTGATTGKTHIFRETPPVAVFASYLIRVRPTKEINSEYLYFFFQSDLYWSQLSSHKEGSAQPNVNGQKLSNIELPIADEKTQKAICRFLAAVRERQDGLIQELPELPYPLGEQRRGVERIESIAARITTAQSLRVETLEDAGNLLIAMAHRSDKNRDELLKEGWEEVRLGEIIHQAKDRCRVEPNTEYPNLGIYSFARGLFHKQPIDGNLTSAKELYRVHKGQFIYSRLFAFEGACGIVTDEYDGCFVSGEYPTFDCDPNRVNPEFLFAYFKSLDVWRTVSAGSKGLGDRRQRVQPEKFLEHKLLLPPLEWQSKITSMMKKIDDLQSIQSQTGEELDALLPSVLDRAFKGEL